MNDPSTPTTTIDCMICGSSQHKPRFTGRDRLLGHPGTFPIVQCQQCGLLYQNPQIMDSAPYYEGNYQPFEQAVAVPTPIIRANGQIAFSGLAGLQYGVLQQATKARYGRLLDIGCASGEFLAAAESVGWDVYGIEPHLQAANIANSRLKPANAPRVVSGPLELAHYADHSFDVITLWHVIEHLPAPIATLREVERILKPGGICIIQTPHWGSLESSLFRSYWAGLDAPRHYWIFSRRTLTAAAAQAGLRVTASLQATGYPLMVISLDFLVSAYLGKHAAETITRWLRNPTMDRIGRLLLRPIELLGYGSQLTFALQHKA
jgi:2-polyprenyl-3-methyl-5-hydroxy-6-metoxy-1,4-benzoquinol methylase